MVANVENYGVVNVVVELVVVVVDDVNIGAVADVVSNVVIRC